eukprot:SAG11_NODE_27_length_23309_cov_10.579362_5_plen_101_part_00
MLPSQVSNREPGVYTAQEKTKGVHLAPEARQKRAASSAFEHVINVRTDCALKPGACWRGLCLQDSLDPSFVTAFPTKYYFERTQIFISASSESFHFRIGQ